MTTIVYMAVETGTLLIGMVLAAAAVGITGIVCGLGLGVANEKFKVEVDEKEIAIREVLPGNNCGGCGFPGCDGCAKAMASGEAGPNQCPVGGATVAAKVAEILGVEAGEQEKWIAFVKCTGTCNHTSSRFKYVGPQDCRQASVIPGGTDKSCTYGCMGYGSCVRACEFDAIHVIDGVAIVDKDKCTACKKCIAACPKNLIELVPYKAKHLVRCSSQEKGKDVLSKCTIGCIACTMCVKSCPKQAIAMNGNVALIDYQICENCGICAEKCPRKTIA